MEQITLKEIKNLLGLEDTSKDKYIKSMIPIAVEFVQDYCENPEIEIKGGLKIGIAKIIEFYMNNSSLQSRSISRINESYLTDIPKSILALLDPYSTSKGKVRFF